MRKLIVFVMMMFSLALPLTVNASSEEEVSVEYFDDGSYLITSIEKNDRNENEVDSYSTTKTKSKTITYYNAEKVAKWYVKVTGTFTYGNGLSTCTSSSVSAKSYASTWKITRQSASKSGNTATATAVAKQYYDGTAIKTINRTVNLKCSPTGEFS